MSAAIRTLDELLRDSAARVPHNVAVVDPGGGTSLSYAELAVRSDVVCDLLLRHGMQPGDRIGLYVPKSIGSVTAVFGILKAGAAYVPVDPYAPPQRNAGIFEDCAIAAAVVAKSLLEDLRAAWPAQTLDVLAELADDMMLVRGQPATDAPAAETTVPGERVAYILYTSGSTGAPKGVVHTHSSALSFIDWCSDTFAPTGRDRFSSHAPFHFDLSVLDLYLPIKHGASLVLIREDVGKQPGPLAQLIAAAGITVWYSTPSILRLLVEYGRLGEVDCSQLRLVLFAGEVFPIKHLRTLKTLWPAPRYFNLYGPTETNVCTYYEVPARIDSGRTEPFGIGWVCANDRAMVVDDQERRVAAGEPGELYISGGSVMQCYWNLAAMTARAFHVDDAGTHWYRTGDMVTETPSEGFLFAGRRDRMVKRRGYRVELGEIEAALYRHPLIAEAAVVALPDDENGVLIRASLSLHDGGRLSMVEMKTFCAENLPGYMIPDRFTYHDVLPKTSTDKIDYERLRVLV
jgi:amino acid adenylation domain-containing protein